MGGFFILSNIHPGLTEASCFLAGRRERYAYISVPALLAVLESHDPIIVCLEDKESFTQALLAAVQSGASEAIMFAEREFAKMSPPSSPNPSPPQRNLQVGPTGIYIGNNFFKYAV